VRELLGGTLYTIYTGGPFVPPYSTRDTHFIFGLRLTVSRSLKWVIECELYHRASGYAEAYRGAHCQLCCRELGQAEAKAGHDRVGVWGQTHYEGPAAFRRRMRVAGE